MAEFEHYKNGTGTMVENHQDDLVYHQTGKKEINSYLLVSVEVEKTKSLTNPSTLYNVVEKFYDALERNAVKNNVIFEIDFGGINLYVSLKKTKEQILEEYEKNYKEREEFYKKNQGLDEEELKTKWQINQRENMVAALSNEKDPLLGMKYAIAGTDVEAMRILNLLQATMGDEACQSYLRVMEKNSIGSDQIKDAYHSDSAGNIQEMQSMVVNNSGELHELSNAVDTPEPDVEEVEIKVKKPDVELDAEEEKKNPISIEKNADGSIPVDLVAGCKSGDASMFFANLIADGLTNVAKMIQNGAKPEDQKMIDEAMEKYKNEKAAKKAAKKEKKAAKKAAEKAKEEMEGKEKEEEQEESKTNKAEEKKEQEAETTNQPNNETQTKQSKQAGPEQNM